MKAAFYFILVAAFLPACLEPSKGSKRIPPIDPPAFELSPDGGSRLRSYEIINALIKARVLSDGQEFKLINLIEPQLGEQTTAQTEAGIIAFLGSYDGRGITMTYTGSHPNALNMLVWDSLMQALGTEIGALCEERTSLYFQNKILNLAKELCAPDESFPRESWQQFWEKLMLADAPISVQESWLTMIEEETNAKESSREEILSLAAYALLFNPYFLIEH